jgi:hypothetical protein
MKNMDCLIFYKESTGVFNNEAIRLEKELLQNLVRILRRNQWIIAEISVYMPKMAFDHTFPFPPAAPPSEKYCLSDIAFIPKTRHPEKYPSQQQTTLIMALTSWTA